MGILNDIFNDTVDLGPVGHIDLWNPNKIEPMPTWPPSMQDLGGHPIVPPNPPGAPSAPS